MKQKIIVPLALLCALFVPACASRAVPTSPAVRPTRAPEKTETPLLSPITPVPAPSPVPATAPAEPPSPMPTATSTPTLRTIQFSYNVIPSQESALEALIAKFNQTHSDIQVVGTNEASAGMPVGAGNRPDVAMRYSHEIAALIRTDAVVSLDGYVEDREIGFRADAARDVFPAFVDRYPQFGNRIHSITFMRSMEVMYYNLDLLHNVGLNRPPETWEEFALACGLVTKPPDTFCYEMKADAADFVGWVYSRGGELLSADGRTAAFNDKPGLEALVWLNERFRKKQAILATRAFQEPSDFAAGRVAFTFDSTQGLAFYERAVQAAGKNVEWGIAPFPHTTPKPVVNVYGSSLVVFKTSPEKQRAAFAFVKWLTDAAPNAEWVKATRYFPARSSTQTALGDFMKANPLYAAAYEWLPYGRSEPNVVAWDSIRGLLGEAMMAVANGKATPEDALKEAGKKANDRLAAP